jgi:hypothetical protein
MFDIEGGQPNGGFERAPSDRADGIGRISVKKSDGHLGA